MLRKIICLLALVLLSQCSSAWAEDMRFVDAEGFTGYYVDASTIYINPENDTSEAWVAVVKADKNRRYLYRMRFDRTHETYEIFQSEVQAYDTKEVLERNDLGRPPRHYGLNSPMNSIVAYIYEWQAEQIRANQKSY